MAKIKKSFLTPKWLVVKTMYENGTNGSDKYGTNFDIGGELDKLTREFIDIIGEYTHQFGWDCVIEGVKMDLWKERIWSLVENANIDGTQIPTKIPSNLLPVNHNDTE